MTFAWPDRDTDDASRRARLGDGEILVYPASTPSLTLVSYARSMISAAFGRLDPELAQFVLADDEFADIVADLGAEFVARPDSAALIRDALGFCGCDLETTCFDVPRLHTSLSAQHPTPGHSTEDTRHRDGPSAGIPSLVSCLIPVLPVSDGGAVIMSSGDRSDPDNTSGRTRFSIEFRTVDITDITTVTAENGIDAVASETTVGDFVRAVDLEPVTEDVARRHRSLDREEHTR